MNATFQQTSVLSITGRGRLTVLTCVYQLTPNAAFTPWGCGFLFNEKEEMCKHCTFPDKLQRYQICFISFGAFDKILQ